jgi:hypothetical protein
VFEEWDGTERRTRKRDEKDLDFTWQSAFYSMRRDISAHLAKEDDNSKDIATIKADLKSIFDPDYGRFSRLEKNVEALLDQSATAKGSLRTAGFLGSGLFAVAIGWDSIVSFLHKLFDK